MRTQKQHLDELLGLVREHPPRRLLGSDELREIVGRAESVQPLKPVRRFTRGYATVLSALVAVGAVGGGLLYMNSTDSITDTSVGTARQQRTFESAAAGTVPETSGGAAPSRATIESPQSAVRTGTAAQGSLSSPGGVRRAPGLSGSSTATHGRDPEGRAASETESIANTPKNTTNGELGGTDVDADNVVSASGEGSAAGTPRLRPPFLVPYGFGGPILKAPTTVQGLEYLTLNDTELEAIGIRRSSSKQIEFFVEENLSGQDPRSAEVFRNLNYEAPSDGRGAVVRTRVTIGATSISGTPISANEPDVYSKIAPVMLTQGPQQQERMVGAALVYSQNSPLLLESGIAPDSIPSSVFGNYAKVALATDIETATARYRTTNRLVPIRIRWSEVPPGWTKEHVVDIALWYVPTPEFVEALPDRYREPLRRELEVMDAVERRRMPAGIACENLAGVPPVLGFCRTNPGAIVSTAVHGNPVSDVGRSTIELAGDRKICITLHDLNGRLIRSLYAFQERPAGASDMLLNFVGVKGGVYLIAYTSDHGEQVVQRVIVR